MKNFIPTLKNMMSYKRGAGTISETRFIERYIETMPRINSDAFGNYFIKIGKNPTNIFTSHTDSVHYESGYQATQVVGNHLMLKDQSSNKLTCLGADDASGMFLMFRLIEIQKPSLYIFYRSEEVGGLGSLYYTKNNEEALKKYDSVISLDRKGTQDVISHQGSRTASDAFCDSLASQLGPKWERSSKGLFTDSANHVDINSENTNLSTGYTFAHSRFESLNITHLIDLLKSLIMLDFSKLVIERKPGEKEYDHYTGWNYDGEIYNPYGNSTSGVFPYSDDIKIEKETYSTYNKNSFNDLISTYPDVAEKLLTDYGCTFSNLQDAIYLQTGELASGLYNEY